MERSSEEEVKFLSDLGIRQVDNPADAAKLGTPTKQVDLTDLPTNATIQTIMNEMREKLQTIMAELGWNEQKGIGLSANQLNLPGIDTNQRIFLYLTTEDTAPKFYINPEITERSEQTRLAWIGCFSDYGQRSATESPKSVTVTFHDTEGIESTASFTGDTASSIHHEFEHLDGEITRDNALKVLGTEEYRDLRSKGKLPTTKEDL